MNNMNEYLKGMQDYLERLQKLAIEDPEAAKKEAHDSLVRMGYIDEEGNVLPPYNGQKVNDTDFTYGPGEIVYGDQRLELKK